MFVGCELGHQWPIFVKYFPNVRYLELDHAQMIQQCTNVSIMLLFQHSQLKILNISMFQSHKLIVNNSHNKRMSVSSTDAVQLIKHHPALIKVDVPYYHFRANDVITLTHNLNSLNKLHFQMLRSEYSHLTSQLNNDCWFFDRHYIYVTLKR